MGYFILNKKQIKTNVKNYNKNIKKNLSKYLHKKLRNNKKSDVIKKKPVHKWTGFLYKI